MPDNQDLVNLYFDALTAMAERHFGLLHISLPEYPSALYLRAMTSDIYNLRQIFQYKEYNIEFPEEPSRILDLGSYAGYSAVYFANRFPKAEIVCVEPSLTNLRILRLNAAAYDNIRILHGAVWYQAAELKLTERIEGEWGSVYTENGTADAPSVRAYTIPEIIQWAGWSKPNYIKCDIEGSELEVFSDSAAQDWLSGVSCVSIETHDRFRPGSTDAVLKALPADAFDHQMKGEFHIFTRPFDRVGAATPAVAISLMPQGLHLRPFELVNVPPAIWGFRALDEETFQLHPPAPGEGRSEIRFPLQLSGQQRFAARCHLPAASESPVDFSVRLHHVEKISFQEIKTVSPGETVELRFDIPRRTGAYTLALGTEMSAGAATNGHARAQWTRPRLE